MREAEVIERLRRIATAPEARGLLDDVALLDGLVITHDSIAEGVHFLPARPAGERRLEAGRGEPLRPRRQGRDAGRRRAVADHLRPEPVGRSISSSGVEAACESYGLAADRRRHHRTARGRAARARPDRHRPRRRQRPAIAPAARPGDRLWLVGTVGDAAAGLAQLRHDRHAAGPLVDIYRRPVPLLGAGQALAPQRPRDDGRLRRTAARRPADGRGERLRRSPSTSTRCRCRDAFIAERGTGCEARCSRRPAATITLCSPRLPPELDPSTLSLPAGTSIALHREPCSRGPPSTSAGQRRRARRAAGELGL